MIPSYDLDVVVTRGRAVESVHRVSAAIARDGALAGSARDPSLHTYWRSCAKPFQLIPLVASGGIDALGWGADEMAIACASHGGEPEHVAIVERMLGSMDLEEGDLACGAQEPLSSRGVRLLRECGSRPTRMHNNCSGKHTAMLARAHLERWPTEGYHRREHPVQRGVLNEVAHWTGTAASDLELAVDGCGVVVFGLPLAGMARAWSALAAAAARGDSPPRRIVEAMVANPFLVGGTDRFDTILMEEAPGIVSKVGAEGVHCAAIPSLGVGIALKVEDGAARAQYPALLALLQQLDVLPATLVPRLAELARKPVRDTRHEVVGEVFARAMI